MVPSTRTSRRAQWPGRLKACAPPRSAVGLGTQGRTATKTWCHVSPWACHLHKCWVAVSRWQHPPTANQEDSLSILPFILEVAALFPEATRSRSPPVPVTLLAFAWEVVRDLTLNPSTCLTHWQTMRRELSFPCCGRKAMETTSMPTSSGSG